jgi:hypothetical protein
MLELQSQLLTPRLESYHKWNLDLKNNNCRIIKKNKEI